jgi:hypothetical protein
MPAYAACRATRHIVAVMEAATLIGFAVALPSITAGLLSGWPCHTEFAGSTIDQLVRQGAECRGLDWREDERPRQGIVSQEI